MKIDTEHIKEAEKILIGGNTFDEERRDFITNLNTIDLLAVPGSGKTTALLAKLYCISRQLPLEKNAGILILSHTNRAVGEIEKRLKSICPNLFQYPNFVGTIQAFVNRFIANQACFELYGSYIRRNEDELVQDEVLRGVKRNYGLKSYLEHRLRDGEEMEDVIKSIRYSEDKFLVKGQSLSFTSNSGNALKNIFDSLRNEGIIFYNDSFILANKYLEEHPILVNILRQRFKYIFIDEMQDLDSDKIGLIERLFFNNSTTNAIQRIGDKNQSIYSGISTLSSDSCWITRNRIDPIKYPNDLTLRKSYRLSYTLANLVDCFVLERPIDYKVVSASKNKENIPPHLLVYKNEEDGKKLKGKFIELIEKFQLDKDQNNIENGFHIIGWTTEKEEDSERWYMKRVFPEYSKEKKQSREDFDCLRKYLCLYDTDNGTLSAIRKSLLNGILRVLRIEKAYFDPERQKHFRKSTLINLIKEMDSNFYNCFKSKLFNWCFSIVTKNGYEVVFQEYKDFITKELPKVIHEFKVDKSNDFIQADNYGQEGESAKISTSTVGNNNIEITLSSVHGVKGQTHCATMYVETEYHGYETAKLSNPKVISNPLFFSEQKRKGSSRKIYDETLKMMYVGFSRPTHLLCFAVKNENVKNDLIKFKEAGWKIISI